MTTTGWFAVLLIVYLINQPSIADPCDSGWESYNEKCFKVMDSSVKTFNEAEKLCRKSNGNLLTIRTDKEQAVIGDFIFNGTNGLVNAVWLGAKFDQNTGQFKWITDHTELSFTNWADSQPKMKQADRECLQMAADEPFVGQWINVQCRKQNSVVCQKTRNIKNDYSKSDKQWQAMVIELQAEIQAMRDQLEAAKSDVRDLIAGFQHLAREMNRNRREFQLNLNVTADRFKKRLRKLARKAQYEVGLIKKDINSFKGQLATVYQGTSPSSKHTMSRSNDNMLKSPSHQQMSTSAVPIGFIYIQLPNQKKPADIWPNTLWNDISETIAGLFFRVAGDGSAGFGQVQEAHAPRIVFMEKRYHPNNAASSFTNYSLFKNSGEEMKLSATEFVYTGDDAMPEYVNAAQSIRFHVSDGEVRPKNIAVLIWKRVG